MKTKLIWLFLPLVLGLWIAVFAVVIPAQAGVQLPVASTSDDDPPLGEKVKGVVESFPETLVGSWTVSGVVYEATADTEFETKGSPFYVGACVEVRYDPGTYLAYKIEMEESDDCGEDDDDEGDDLRFIGLIEQVPVVTETLFHDTPGISGTWVISGVNFVSTYDTKLKTKHGPLTVGACAKVKYSEVNGVNLAREISSEKLYHCYDAVSFNQAYGYVVTFPEDLQGAWVISNTVGMSLSFITSPSTHIKIHPHYPLEAGVCVKVKYFTDQGISYATQVKTTKPHHCEGSFSEFEPLSKLYAAVDAMPPTGTLTGTWTLAGVNFTVTQETRIEEEQGPFAIGSCAESKYDPTNGAMLVHKLESEEAEDCQADDGTPRFKLYGVVEIMPTTGYTGTWQVSGVSFTVTPSTTVESRHGDFAIGAYVKVYFTYDALSGERTAQLVKTHVAPGYGHHNFRARFDGWNFSAVGDQVILDGSSYATDPDIDAPADLQAGDQVWVNSYQTQDGTFVTQVALEQVLFLPMVNQQ